jgi:hypothetical protein
MAESSLEARFPIPWARDVARLFLIAFLANAAWIESRVKETDGGGRAASVEGKVHSGDL